jgi:hypothetical protein
MTMGGAAPTFLWAKGRQIYALMGFGCKVLARLRCGIKCPPKQFQKKWSENAPFGLNAFVLYEILLS